MDGEPLFPGEGRVASFVEKEEHGPHNPEMSEPTGNRRRIDAAPASSEPDGNR
jgi:hypothetical protein